MVIKQIPKIFIVIFLALVLVSSGQSLQKPAKEAQSPKPPVLSAKDTLRINQVSGPRLSPDGQWVLYTKQTRDMEDKDMKSTTHIWRVRADGTGRRQMTFGSTSCTSPSWFPDGQKIAFLSRRSQAKPTDDQAGPLSRGAKNQIYCMYFDGGEAWQVTNHEEGIQSFQISPDGTKILFTSLDPLSKEEKKKRKEKDDTEVVDQKYRMSHLWIYDLNKNEEMRLTQGKFTVSDARWSPDGQKIVYVTRPTPKSDDGWKSDIWLIDLETKTTQKLYDNPGRDFNPRWSPDGQTIAFASDPHPYMNTWYNKLYLIPSNGGKPRVLLKDFDLDFQNPIWSPDGKMIYWATGDRTTINLFAVNVKSGQVKKIVPPRGANYQWEMSKDGQSWVWVHTDPSWPGEIYASDLELKKHIRLSEANPWLKEEKIKLAEVKTVKWKNHDGQWIEGVLTLPVDYDQTKKYPFILNPHGGPSGARVESFSSTNQFFAGNGFMVLEPNFRGSSNYGQEFLNANRGQWGIRDYDDCMTGVDYCLEQGWADPERLVCYGWSYGGYMSYWIVTQTNRFKAVSPGAGLANLYSMYSTNDIPHYMAWFLGTPWDHEETYEKLSPIRHVKNVKSAVLIMQGAADNRVPPTQAVEFYQALKDLDKDVTFVRFPREGHGIREPRHRIDRLRRYLFFFAKHVNLTPVSEKEAK